MTKIKNIIESHEIDINNFTNEDISYRLNTIFKLQDLDFYRSRNVLLRSAWNNKDHELHMWGDVPVEVDKI